MDNKIDNTINKLKKIFRDNLYERNILSKTGSVNFNRLGMAKTSKYIFNKKEETKGYKYNVELLLDASGSMYYNGRLGSSALALYMIYQALKKLVNVNITLFNYTEYKIKDDNDIFLKTIRDTIKQNNNISSVDTRDLTNKLAELKLPVFEEITAYKNKNNKKTYILTDKEKLRYNLNENEYEGFTFDAMAGNYDITNIINTINSLKKQKGGKIIIIISDGRPHLDYHSVTGEYDLFLSGNNIKDWAISGAEWKNKLNEIINNNQIKLISIGLKTEEPARYYNNFYLIEEIDNTYNVLIKSLEKAIWN